MQRAQRVQKAGVTEGGSRGIRGCKCPSQVGRLGVGGADGKDRGCMQI